MTPKCHGTIAAPGGGGHGSFAVGIAAAAALLGPAMAESPTRVMIGTLACDVSGGIGWLVASRRDVVCTFTPAQHDPAKGFIASIGEFDLSGGAPGANTMVWAVHAPADRRSGTLTGHYTSASADMTVGASLGANALLGGSDRSVALQPVATQGDKAVNLATGVRAMDLYPGP